MLPLVQGFLRLSVIQEGGLFGADVRRARCSMQRMLADPRSGGGGDRTVLTMIRAPRFCSEVFISGVQCWSGADLVVTINTFNNKGNILVVCKDEVERWRWFCAINAGLHRVSPAKALTSCMPLCSDT